MSLIRNMQMESDDLLDSMQEVAKHFHDCPDAKTNLPSCSLNGHGCSLSCLQLWFNHLNHCEFCVHHLISRESCHDNHCNRIRELWKLRELFSDFMVRNKLMPDGHVYQNILTAVKSLLPLDFHHLHYLPRRNDKSWNSKLTSMVFECLENLIKFQLEMTNYDMKIDNGDLAILVNGLVDNKIPTMLEQR